MKKIKLSAKYTDLLNTAKKVNGRKETVSLLHKAERIRIKMGRETGSRCTSCYGSGFKRVSLNYSKTCLRCFGKGYTIKKNIKNLI